MGYTIINPPQSFVQFNVPDVNGVCGNTRGVALPVYEEADISFQVVIQADTPEEANQLCGPISSNIAIGIVFNCDEGFVYQFPERPSTQRISDTMVNLNWPHGVTGMIGTVNEGECFRIKIEIGEFSFCSNVFRRINQEEACETAVLEYGNNENAFGFVYCGSAEGVQEAEDDSCAPEVVTFINQTNLVIPYTSLLANKFGPVPTVQVWIYDENGYPTNIGVQARFDQMPPTKILVDLGGTASGFIVIR